MAIIFDMPDEQSSIIKVIGVGGGGNNAVNFMYEQGIKGVNFVVCNTDAQALETSPVPNKIQLGPTLTNGRGAGAAPEVGKNATLESEDEIRDLLSINTKMVFVTAGMGGGTGTGGAPVVAKIARELGLLTVGIVTIPFEFEGQKKRTKAEQGLLEMKKNVDAMIVISNNKLRDIYGDLGLTKAFSHADSILSTAAKGISEIITKSGMINVDFEDVKTVMTNSGVALMGTGTASGENRAVKAIDAAMSSPLLNDDDIHGARGVLLNITSGKEEIRMDEVTQITEYVQQAAATDAEIIWGVCYDETLEDEISVTLIATGFDGRKFQRKEEKAQRIVHRLDGPERTGEAPQVEATTPEAASTPSPGDPEEEARDEDMEILTSPVRPATVSEPEKPKSTMTFFDQDEEETPGPIGNAGSIENGGRDVAVVDPDEYGFDFEDRDYDDSPEPDVFPAHPDNSDCTFDLFDAREEPKPRQEPRQEPRPAGPARQPDMANVQLSRVQKLKKYVTLSRFKNNENLRDLENQPAYERKNVQFQRVPHSGESAMSRYSLDDTTGKPEIRENNSFLHDNVD